MLEPERDLERLATLRRMAFSALDAANAPIPLPPKPISSKSELDRYLSQSRLWRELHEAALAASEEYLKLWRKLRDELGENELKRVTENLD